MDAIYKKWCEKLLDTGKRNPLINYKDKKLGTIDILKPECNEVFEKIFAGKVLIFYDVDEYVRKLEDKSKKVSNEEQIKQIGKQQIVESIAPQLKVNQVLSFKEGFTLRKILSGIRKKAKASLTERGINILYMAFGFLNWKENENSEDIKSPLVLIPIVIENKDGSEPFTVRQYEDEVTTNPTLLYKIEHEFGIKLHPEIKFVGKRTDEEDELWKIMTEN